MVWSCTVLSVLSAVHLSSVYCQRYIVPEARIELLSPRGLKISIPDIDEGVSLVAFHINVNEEFDGLEHGQWAKDILKSRGGRWTYTIPDLRVKLGDTIYYWVYAIVDGLGYQALDKSFKVTQVSPHGNSGTVTRPPPPPPPTPSPTPSPTPEVEAEKLPQEPVCQQSTTIRNNGLKTCRGHVLLDHSFDNLYGWNHEVRIGGNEPEDEFTVFTTDSAVSYTDSNGNLVIRPKLLEDKHSEEFVKSGTLTLEGCTSAVAEQCSRTGVSYIILPPVMGARIHSRGSFSFRYGVLEITAKLPHGDWIVPELRLEPFRSPYANSGRVVLAMSRGNGPTSQILEAGVVVSSGPQLGRKVRPEGWHQGYHTFKLVWTEDLMEFSVDGEMITRLPGEEGVIDRSLGGGRVAPFDKEYYISLGLHVAGGYDFPDDMSGKPWKNTNPKRFVSFWTAKDSWKRTWGEDSALYIKSIKVTAL